MIEHYKRKAKNIRFGALILSISFIIGFLLGMMLTFLAMVTK
jgi:hypothetical protein